jgi:hypothetical protein
MRSSMDRLNQLAPPVGEVPICQGIGRPFPEAIGAHCASFTGEGSISGLSSSRASRWSSCHLPRKYSGNSSQMGRVSEYWRMAESRRVSKLSRSHFPSSAPRELHRNALTLTFQDGANLPKVYL